MECGSRSIDYGDRRSCTKRLVSLERPRHLMIISRGWNSMNSTHQFRLAMNEIDAKNCKMKFESIVLHFSLLNFTFSVGSERGAYIPCACIFHSIAGESRRKGNLHRRRNESQVFHVIQKNNSTKISCWLCWLVRRKKNDVWKGTGSIQVRRGQRDDDAGPIFILESRV